jgi:hypothetical protein
MTTTPGPTRDNRDDAVRDIGSPVPFSSVNSRNPFPSSLLFVRFAGSSAAPTVSAKSVPLAVFLDWIVVVT